MSDYLINHQLLADDVAVILAALRLLERTPGRDISDEIVELAGDSLEVVNIDLLCQRLCLDGQLVDASVPDERDTLIRRIRAELSRPEWDSDTPANLASALADAGWPPFILDQEGWYLDVVDDAYAVVPDADGTFQSSAEATTAIAQLAAVGSRWHDEVLDTIGMTACGQALPLMRIEGLGPNGMDVVVTNELRPERCLEVGYRANPFDLSSPERVCDKSGFWAIYRRDPWSGLAQWVIDCNDQHSALTFCASYLDVALNDETCTLFSSYFR